ncbi:metallophosphoesterase [Candidatus Hydrogenedentota bacterium]
MDRRTFIRTITQGVSIAFLSGCATARRKPADGLQFTFGAIADIQYGDKAPGKTRFYRESVGKLEECVDYMNTQDLEFVVHLGDLVDDRFADIDKILPVFNKLTAPGYHVLGNHDVVFPERDQVPAKLGMDAEYYDFATKGWRFIVLDGNDITMYSKENSETRKKAEKMLAALKAAKAVNSAPWCGALSEEQMAWLRSILQDATSKGERAVVFCHMPVYPSDPHNLWNDKAVISLLESFPCVAAYMNGNNHAGNYAEKNGIHYLNLRSMVDTPDQSAYATVDVYADRFEVNGFGMEPTHTLRFGGEGRK